MLTPRFELLPFTPSDLSLVHQGLSHPEVIKYYGISCNTLEEAQAQLDWFERIEAEGSGRWRAIRFREGGVFVGAIGFNYWNHETGSADFGFWLLPEHWGQSVMKEVIPAMVRHGLQEMKLQRIEAEVETGNVASRNLLLKCGFVHETTKMDCEEKNGTLISLDVFVRLA